MIPPEQPLEICSRQFDTGRNVPAFETSKEYRKEKEDMDIKVLGPGCPKCQQTEKVVKKVVAETGLDATVEKVTDTMKIAGYGVFLTPAVVVDGEVKSVGKVPSKDDVKKWVSR